MFEWDEIKMQTVHNSWESWRKNRLFFNIIPDYNRLEGTYDLLRKTSDAPGVLWISFLWNVRLFQSQHYQFANLVLLPVQD